MPIWRLSKYPMRIYKDMRPSNGSELLWKTSYTLFIKCVPAWQICNWTFLTWKKERENPAGDLVFHIRIYEGFFPMKDEFEHDFNEAQEVAPTLEPPTSSSIVDPNTPSASSTKADGQLQFWGFEISYFQVLSLGTFV